MKIKASSKMDLAACKALLQATYTAYSDRRMIIQSIIMAIDEILLIVCYFASADIASESIRKATIAISIILPFLEALVVLQYFYMPKRTYKHFGDYKDGTNTFVFNDFYFTETTTTPDGQKSKSSTFNYCDVLKTIETDKYIFIYINRRSAYIVEKDTVDIERIGDLRAKLSDKKIYIQIIKRVLMNQYPLIYIFFTGTAIFAPVSFCAPKFIDGAFSNSIS